MPGHTFLFYVFIILMMYPGVANMVPTFKLISSLGLYNSHWSLILLGTAGAQAFTIYVLRNFIEEIPQDLFDAAEVDGCSLLRQIKDIVVPLSMPILGTLAVLRIIGEWNRFVGALIFIRDSHKQMLAVSLLPFVIHISGYLYLAGALLLGCGFIYHAWKLLRSQGSEHAMQTFGYSIVYLSLLFALLLVDHYLMPILTAGMA